MKRLASSRDKSIPAIVGLILLAVVFAARVVAQDSSGQPLANKRPSIVVDGTHWANASADERRAFLVGIGNMIVTETAYAHRHELDVPPVCDGIVKGIAHMKLADLEAHIDGWYEAHPDEQGEPVMKIIWLDIVKKNQSTQ